MIELLSKPFISVTEFRELTGATNDKRDKTLAFLRALSATYPGLLIQEKPRAKCRISTAMLIEIAPALGQASEPLLLKIQALEERVEELEAKTRFL